jgi:hypothetical protein
MKKPMSDGEVNDYVANKMMGDLDGIEAHGLFDEQDNPTSDTHGDVKIEAHGVSVAIKPMNGEQTKTQPVVEDVDESEDDLGKYGL